MIAKAIGPQNTVGAIGIMPRTVEMAVSMIGRKRGRAGVEVALPDVLAFSSFSFDLADQDNGVLGNHAEQRQNAEYGDEPEWPAGQQQGPDDTDQSERRDAKDDKQAWKLRSCTISTVNMISSIAGTTAMTEACAFALSSTTPPVTIR